MEALRVSFKASILLHQVMQGPFAGMTEWGMADIMCQADSLHQIRIDEKIVVQKRGRLFQERTDRAPDLSDFERMSQPRPVKVELARKKNLSLGLQSTKG